GVVPGHDAQQRTDRGLTDPGRARRVGRQRLVLEQVGPGVGVVAVDADRELQLTLGLGRGLAHLARDDRAQLGGPVLVELGHPAQDVGALAHGGPPPRRIAAPGPVQDLADLRVRGRRVLLLHLASGRVHNLVLHRLCLSLAHNSGGRDQRAYLGPAGPTRDSSGGGTRAPRAPTVEALLTVSRQRLGCLWDARLEGASSAAGLARAVRTARRETGMVAMDNGGAKVRVAVLGTGIMGSAMARNLISAGLGTTVWDRSPAATAPLAAAGALVAASPVEAVRDAGMVITMLPT